MQVTGTATVVGDDIDTDVIFRPDRRSAGGDGSGAGMSKTGGDGGSGDFAVAAGGRSGEVRDAGHRNEAADLRSVKEQRRRRLSLRPGWSRRSLPRALLEFPRSRHGCSS